MEGCAVAQFAAEGKLPPTRARPPRNSDAIAMIHSPNAAKRSFRRSVHDMCLSKQFGGSRSGATAGLSSSAKSEKTLLDKPAVPPRSPRGFTLIEMLVALAATLLMMGATVTLFGVIVDSVSGSRSLLEISDKLRATRNRIQADLQGATATMRPPLRPENDEGYLEIVEGPNFDGAPNAVPPPPGRPLLNTLFGDTDDALLLTVRSRGEPFVGKFRTLVGPPAVDITIESQVAEIAYFLKQDGPIIDTSTTPPLRLCTLYRRAMLVVPGQQSALATANSPAGPPLTPGFYDIFDVSARVEGVTPARVANTLGDLTKPENRFGRQLPVGGTLPFRFLPNIDPSVLAPAAFNGTSGRFGDDILMTNVLSFDVQVYDPGAPIKIDTVNNVAIEPRDQGYSIPPSPTAFGAYADLGYAPGYTAASGNPPALFNLINQNPKSGYLSTPTTPRVYDTWSWHYENNGMDNTGAPGGDLATNGLDDDNANGVDDILERDTLPPYSAPLRGVRITIRVYEPSSLQVRQVTIVQDFLPE